jgi:putative membrane protein
MAKEEIQKQEKRVLILCVDRDGDLGAKAQIKTPIVGRDENLNAAVALALKDPEEPDANAMFEAVRVFDNLQNEGKTDEIIQMATVSGTELGGVGADRKVVSELGELLKDFPANEVILVTDGYSDEAILPLVESRVPVSSVRRIVVKHSESIEETAALFTRYLRTVMENPRYSRIALGLPGLLLLILVIFSMLNLLYYYWIAFIFVLGVYMLGKGFGVDKQIKGFYRWIKEYSPPPLRVQISNYAAIAGALSVIVGIYLGLTKAAGVAISPGLWGWLNNLPELAGNFILGSEDLVIVGICVFLSGRAIRYYLQHDTRLLRNAALIVIIGWSREILDTTSAVLNNRQFSQEFIFTIIVGILIGIASFLVEIIIRRSAKDFFRKTEGQAEDFEEG